MKEAIRQAETPTPISARAAIAVAAESAAEKAAAPAAATSSNVAFTRRGPSTAFTAR